MRIDAHHHLWELTAVDYPWLMERGAKRFFGDPTPIQRNYLIGEFRAEAGAAGFSGSVHVQVGAANALDEVRWVQSIADANPDWPMAQVAFCDLTASDLDRQLDILQRFSTVRGIRQIVGRAPEEDAASGTNDLLRSQAFAEGLRELGRRGLSFDLQLIPDLMESMAAVLLTAPDTRVALCHAGSPYDRSSQGLANWGARLRSLSSLPQVRCKLSGLGMFEHDWTADSIRPIVETCLEQFGAARCMFGSNFPVDSLYSDYRAITEAFSRILPDRDQASVFGATAADHYKLLRSTGHATGQ